jgi:hypothetical protein
MGGSAVGAVEGVHGLLGVPLGEAVDEFHAEGFQEAAGAVVGFLGEGDDAGGV